MNIDDFIIMERLFLEQQGAIKNEHGVYVYQSKNGAHLLRLDCFLAEYKEWLIENQIVKENECNHTSSSY